MPVFFLTLALFLGIPNYVLANSDCRECHVEENLGERFDRGAHKDLQCSDCHVGVKLPHAKGFSKAAALTACPTCHEGSLGKPPGLIMHAGQAVSEPNTGMPYCLDCHGDPHVVRSAAALTIAQRRNHITERCLHCHDDTSEHKGKEVLELGAIKDVHRGRIAETYEHSVHGRKLHLGSDKAPGCAECHGGHLQKDMKAEGEKVCAQCHKGIAPAFASFTDHRPYTFDKRPVSFVTIKFFAILTFLTILGLCMHVGMDLFGVFRRRLDGQPMRPSHEGPHAEQSVERFDIHQRLQHGLMASSFIMLVVTGWPLSQVKVDTSKAWAQFFGGIDACGRIHRIAGIVLILAAVYHLFYLLALGGQKKLKLTMLPTPKDAIDAFQNILYFLGVRKDPPKFARFSYVEKFDYWAVFWGMVIMGGSGLLRWFPEAASRYMPGWVYEIGLHAHTDEALLAAMAIFLWHFYNVHLRPAIFPMSWVFLHGRLTVAELKHEHPLEYEELVRQGKIRK